MVNWDAFRTIIPRIWRTTHAVEVEVIGTNIFVFTFNSSVDRSRVLAGGPWCFDNALLVLEESAGAEVLANIKFVRVMFWVQIHNTPLLCMNKETCQFLGSLIGEAVKVDLGMAGDCFGKYLRVRRYLYVVVADDEPKTILLLKYERLPDICTHCDFVEHVIQDCLLSLIGGFKRQDNMKFGTWLRATSPSKNQAGRVNSGASSFPKSMGPTLDGAMVLNKNPLTSQVPHREKSFVSKVEDKRSIGAACSIDGPAILNMACAFGKRLFAREY
ncbi:hypothetical protein ACOSQ4_014763 [Xanthoceras sorbifolium]